MIVKNVTSNSIQEICKNTTLAASESFRSVYTTNEVLQIP